MGQSFMDIDEEQIIIKMYKLGYNDLQVELAAIILSGDVDCPDLIFVHKKAHHYAYKYSATDPSTQRSRSLAKFCGILSGQRPIRQAPETTTKVNHWQKIIICLMAKLLGLKMCILDCQLLRELIRTTWRTYAPTIIEFLDNNDKFDSKGFLDTPRSRDYSPSLISGGHRTVEPLPQQQQQEEEEDGQERIQQESLKALEDKRMKVVERERERKLELLTIKIEEEAKRRVMDSIAGFGTFTNFERKWPLIAGLEEVQDILNPGDRYFKRRSSQGPSQSNSRDEFPRASSGDLATSSSSSSSSGINPPSSGQDQLSAQAQLNERRAKLQVEYEERQKAFDASHIRQKEQ